LDYEENTRTIIHRAQRTLAHARYMRAAAAPVQRRSIMAPHFAAVFHLTVPALVLEKVRSLQILTESPADVSHRKETDILLGLLNRTDPSNASVSYHQDARYSFRSVSYRGTRHNFRTWAILQS